MTVKCPYCETNTHPNTDKCDRVFITKEEALSVLNSSCHTIEMLGPIQFCFHFSKYGMIELLNQAEHIEIADPEGEERKMNYGIAIFRRDYEGIGHQIFLETDEEKLKEFELKLKVNKPIEEKNEIS